MMQRQKYHACLVVLLVLMFCNVNSIQPMPLCSVCAADDGYSCITCQTCQQYSVLVSGYCSCASGYYLNQNDANNVYCDRCHSSCKKCFGSLPSNCITCVDRFDYNQTGSVCTAPNNSTDQTLIEAYSYYGFNFLAGWSYPTQTSGVYSTICDGRSILGGIGVIYGGSPMTVIYTTPSIPYHYELRVKMGFYIFNNGGSTAQAWVKVSPAAIVQNKTYSYGTTSVNQCTPGGTDYIHFNIDDTFPHSDPTATVEIGLTQGQWYGIREFYLIVKKCKAQNCSLCAGYDANQCTQCVDSKRIPNNPINNGTCLCNGVYYQEPYSGQCVDPCPSVPIQYYGDPTTRFCKTSCPPNYFALDDTYRCQLDCPTTSSKSGYLLFRDNTNKKCVSICPDTQPYAYPLSTDRNCYANCPVGTYATDAKDRRCVTTCPYNATYKLYAYNGKCVAICPVGLWADPFTIKCLANCTSASYPFKDNSTGTGQCVSMCPGPNFYGQTTNYTCVQTCPNGTYGEIYDTSNALLRRCLSSCNSPRWGLITDNRKCIDFCPQGFWGQPVNRTCTNVSTNCGTLYADNATRTCVAAASCSYGFYADNTTRFCLPYCPQGSFAHPTTKICQLWCDSPYFADDGLNMCVTACNTTGTYADVDSNRSCATACNASGATPWADQSTRTCVSDCNNTVQVFLSDNTTWKCVYFCPANYYADFTTTAPKCVDSCPPTYYADNSTGTGVCVQTCSSYPRKFGDVVGGKNVCVDVCSAPTLFGDETGNRLCKSACTGLYYAQNDSERLCVLKCKDKTYGWNNVCLQDPKLCPGGYFGDDYTNKCVNLCPISQGTFGDPQSKMCVRKCPANPNYPTSGPATYYADISSRLCVLTCNATYLTGLYGNNNTRTCETKCLDKETFAQTQTINRLCVAVCLQVPSFRYANNDTKVCGDSLMCELNYYGQNTTQRCVEFCPNGSFAYKTGVIKLCVDQCPLDSSNVDWYGDITTSKRICVSQCPSLPLRFADPTTKLCVQTCPSPLYGDTVARTCVPLCPVNYFAHLPTRRCVSKCPSGFFGDDTANVRYCHPNSALCGVRFGDPYKNLCVGVCTGPTPVSYFGSGDDCVLTCPNGTYADSDTGTRLCVVDCPNYSGSGGRDLYGDPLTRTCEPKCIQLLTWADYQTRDCQSPCSALPIPTYSQNFNMRCVTSLNCPTIPSMTFGDNTTRSCLSNCTNDEFGDPTTRNCVTQCPKQIVTGTEHYYGDKSTGINLCITVCPSMPRLFGDNVTNLCVSQCPSPYYGDQTGKRSCMSQCPIVFGVYYYSQNISRICVKICMTGTWGLQSSRECVEDPFLCGSQWADNTTNMCVTTCPITSDLYGDPTTKFCVPFCPPGYYSDDKTRTCVQRCPQNNGALGTFGDNSTRVCEQNCQQPNAYADSQTLKRYCVLLCSQSPQQSFSDPSTKSCVAQCPSFPSLYAQTQNFKCVSKCLSPYYANTNTRRCELACPTGQFKLNGSQLCVAVCPQNPDLYADSGTGFCQSTCTNNYHRYPTTRTCIPSCQGIGLFMYNFTCVKYCPYGYYADASGICVSPCPPSTYGENTTTACTGTCITGYAQGSICVAKCDDGLFGENKICTTSCTSPSRASNQTNLCVSMCEAGTYQLNGKCQLACTTGYADPSTNICNPTCSNGRYGDSTTKKCVQTCPSGYYRDSTGFCLSDCSPNNRAADNITWNCETKCSDGTWDYNFKCVNICPPGFYGYPIDRRCYTILDQPDPSLFADNNSQVWLISCPLSPLRFGDRTKKQCVPSCIIGQFADPTSRQCQTSCKNSSYFADTTTGRCVLICSKGFFANTNNNKCQDKCTGGKFAYGPSYQCVSTCPVPYYGYNDGNGLLTCVLNCPIGTYAQGRVCSGGCSALFADPVTNTCVGECLNSFANIGTHKCESSCGSLGKIADNSSNSCVPQCPTDPDLYQENSVCVSQCANGSFADPTPGIRGCRSGCTEGLYAEPQSKRCLPTCKPGYFGRNLTNICSKTCLTGQFADSSTGFCQATCPSPTFADPLLHACVQICSGNQWGQGRVCVPQCSAPSFSNPLTRTCELSCPQFDQLFGQNTTHSCVKDCKIVANSYADKFTRRCMDACSQTLEYALISEGRCVSLCPEGLFMDNNTKQCDPTCTNGFAQPTSRYCVARCFGAPDTYGHTDANGIKTCKYKCLSVTENLYADNRTNLCVDSCTDPMYSDPLTGNCALFCPEGLYAQDTGRTCSSSCNTTQFADNLTRKCVNQCPTLTEQTYGYFGNNTCMRVCPTGYFARNDTKQCVLPIDCPANSWADPISKYCVSRCPSDPLSFGYDTEGTCVSTCPLTLTQDLFGEFVNQRCVSACGLRNGNQTYEDTYTRTCVFRCPISQQLWADTTDDRCKKDCSGGQIRDNSTQKCVSTCPSNPQSYADLNTLFCVRTCPDGKFASDSTTRVCTSNCSAFSFTFGDNTTNRCTANCPIPYFADNSTYLCVLNCPQSVDYYADPHSQTCVKNCPKGATWVSFADPDSRSCVTKCAEGSYGVNSTQRCLPQCPPNSYADQQLNLCVADCTVRPGFYKQLNTRVCVSQCPQLVETYKSDLNNSCLQWNIVASGCPDTYYGNPLNKMCTTKCPAGYFAEDNSKMCVQQCPPDYFADPTDRRCKTACTTTPEYYIYTVTRVCLQHCPAPYFKNNQTYRCTQDCSTTPLMFKYEQTRECVFNCHYPFFAHTPNQTCLASCPDGYYAQQSTRSCVVTCDDPYFADNSTNRCVDVCPSSPDFYGHLKVCRFFCPSNFYKDNSTRMCVANCPIQPLMFADNSTNTCVKMCPADQNFFADNVTRKCVLNCSVGLFAQVQSRTCLKTCPKNLLTYADPTTRVCQPTCPPTYYASEVTKQCVPLCPDEPVKTYAHINKCLQRCPQNFYGQNSTRVCRANCSNLPNIYADDTKNLCVTTCSVGLFAQNDTDSCVPQCPTGSFADPTTRICVEKCPGTQRLFADPSNQQCVSQCSIGYYGDSLNWVCLESCPETASGYRLQVGRLCVQECPSPYFAFVPTRTCVQNCGRGLYGDSVTRTCKDCPSQCPTCLSPSSCLTCISTKYLSYGACVDTCILNDEVANYANDETRSCVVPQKCPDGLFGLNSTGKCSSTCIAQQYKNSTTRRCQNCPQYCTSCKNITYCTNCTSDALYSAQDSFCYPFCNATHKYYLKTDCVQTCPDGTYLDYTAIHCEACNQICMTCFGNALNCTSCFQSFKLDGKCLTTCPSDYYAENGECKVCTADVESCVKPLSFEVKQTIQNYQPVLVVKFNQQTVINGDPKSFVKVRLSMKSRRLQDGRRLQSQADLINDGMQFEAQVLADGTMKLKLQPGMSLDNVKFEVIFTDANAVQTKSGQALQSLQGQIELQTVEIYPPDTLSAASKTFQIIGVALSVAMIAPVFLLLICSPVAVYQPLQAFQLISLFAYVNELPPNLFYFLKQLKISRFTFLPSMFARIYQVPNYFTDKIPLNVASTEGQLSFSVNAGGFTVIAILYALIWGIVYAASSKVNGNRPLRNIFTEIYNSRVKYGLIHDLLWIFSINVFVSAFMQYRLTDNGGDVAIGTIFMLVFATGIGYMIYKLRQYQNTSYDEKQLKLQQRSNLSFYIQGLKESIYRQHTTSVYYIRKILFVLIIAAVINQSFAQAIILVIVQLIMCIYLIVMRPYVDNVRNILHFLNEFGIGFVPCGIIYFIKIKEMKEPIGHKIICGQIISYVIIAHLCVILIWAYLRAYFFLKELYNAFKETQFYKLYMDEQYENELEKQIRELNDQENGEVQSVQITNYNDKKNLGDDDEDEGDQIIKLKIKRRRIKGKKPLQQQEVIEPKRYDKTQYVKLQEPKEQQIEKAIKLNVFSQASEYQKVQSFDESNNQISSINENIGQKLIKPVAIKNTKKSIHSEEWVSLKFDDKSEKDKAKDKSSEWVKLEQKQNKLTKDDNDKFEQVSSGFISEMTSQVDANEQQKQTPLIYQQLKANQQHNAQDLKSEQIFDMIISDGEQKKEQDPSSNEFQQIKKSDQNFSDLNIKVENQILDQEYENEDFDNFNDNDGWIPSNQAAQKSKPKPQKQVKTVKLDDLPLSESNVQAQKLKKQVNNWGELQGILEDEDHERKEEKKKIQMMIFDEEDFESENNN